MRLLLRWLPLLAEAGTAAPLGPGERLRFERARILVRLGLLIAPALGSLHYQPDMDRDAVNRPELTGELRRAIEQDKLLLHFQPKMQVAKGRVVGVEALVRWQHPRAAWEFLERLGCDEAQGFFLARPLAADALLEWLDAEREQAA